VKAGLPKSKGEQGKNIKEMGRAEERAQKTQSTRKQSLSPFDLKNNEEVNVKRVAYQGGEGKKSVEPRNSKHEKETLRSFIDSPQRRPEESASGQSESADNEDQLRTMKETLKKEIEREQNMMYGKDKSNDESSSLYQKSTPK
jgi:hypothetical protein